ncbi:MAG: aspartyl protease family protein [Planctomycetes bacterium]|nr:aspartyl protease family protein [Planctomycetota bacterium]
MSIGDWALLFLDARRELVILPSEGLLKSLSAFIESGTPLESMEIGGVDRIPIMPLHLMDADKTVDLHVDTGSTHTALPPHALEALGVNAGTATESTTLAGKETRRAWKVLGFPLGNQRVDLTIRDTGGETGLLGYDALRQRIFVLDGPGQRLLIEAPATAR